MISASDDVEITIPLRIPWLNGIDQQWTSPLDLVNVHSCSTKTNIRQ